MFTGLVKTLGASALLLPCSLAFAWETKIVCNQGAVVYEEECWSYRGAPCYSRGRQLVIRDSGVVDHFRRGHADGSYNYNSGNPYWYFGGNEIVVSFTQEYQVGLTGSRPIQLDIPYADAWYNAEYRFRREGNGLLVEAFKTSDTRNDIVPKGLLANWYFESCEFRD